MSDEVVGRGIELAAVGRLLAGAEGALAALVVEGEAGIGKSTIWDAGVAAATDAGYTVMSCRPARSEKRLTLGALTDLLAHIESSGACRIRSGTRSRSHSSASRRRGRSRTSAPSRWPSPACCDS